MSAPFTIQWQAASPEAARYAMLLTSCSPMLCPTAQAPRSVAAGMAYRCRCSSGSSCRLNMSSILCVMRNPPPMLTALCVKLVAYFVTRSKASVWVLRVHLEGGERTARTAVAARHCAVLEGRRPPPSSTMPPTAVSPAARQPPHCCW